MNGTRCSRIGFVLGAAFLGTLTGCVGHGHDPDHARVYAQPPPVHTESRVVVLDNYVYYPGYQVYYSSNRRQYMYQDGRSWVSRPAPPRVSADVLYASPSVRVDFHDHPSIHHATVVKQYPKKWKGNKGHGKGNDRADRK